MLQRIILKFIIASALLSGISSFLHAENDEKGLPGQDYEASREEIIPPPDDYDNTDDGEANDDKKTDTARQDNTDTQIHTQTASGNSMNTPVSHASNTFPAKKTAKTTKQKNKKNQTIKKNVSLNKERKAEKPQLKPIWIYNSFRKSITKFHNRYNDIHTEANTEEDFSQQKEENAHTKKQKLILLRCKKGCPPPPGSIPVEEENLPSSSYLILEKYDCWKNATECEPESLLLTEN